ncbi:MAG: CRTAC1 family protein [Phycisphaerales bacterium]|nr:CRTAC1 family protein [Phycisphaerales bacterium]
MRRAKYPSILSAFVVVPAVTAGASAQIFQEVGTTSGLQPYTMSEGMGGGVSAADYDNDGLVDLFVTNGSGVPDQLYRNLGNGNFEEIAADAGLDSTFENRSSIWFDFDGDADLDLLVANDVIAANTAYRFYRQDTPYSFTDMTHGAQLYLPRINPGPYHRGGICVGDINQDRYVDIIAAVWNGPIDVFLNDGDGTFTNASNASNIGGTCVPGLTCPYAHQPMLADFNKDGWLDLYVNIDFAPNQLWINNRDGTFTNVASAAGADNAMNDMGMAIGDYDNDGDLDIYVTNIYGDDPNTLLPEYNVLLRNDSVLPNLSFTDVSFSLGVEYGGWGWGTTFMDCDNNGWMDIAATNGWRSGNAFLDDPSKFYLNTGGNPVDFNDVSATVQFDDTYYGSCLITFDYDRDGDLDLMQTCQSNDLNPTLLRLLQNQAKHGGIDNYLVVKPRMNGPNHRAIGATVQITKGSLNMMRLITAGTSYLGQEPAEAFFGVANATTVDSLTIDWPDGSSSTRYSVATNQVITITHGGFGDLDADGDIDDIDFMTFEPCYVEPSAGSGILYATGCQPADMNGDGDVDCDDWQVFENAYLADRGFLPTLDMPDFVTALIASEVSPAHRCIADMNKDGANDANDIQDYVAALLAMN